MKRFGELLDRLSNYFAARKGLLPVLGAMLVLLNLLVQFLPSGWLGESDLLLHLGVILAIFGFLLAWAL